MRIGLLRVVGVAAVAAALAPAAGSTPSGAGGNPARGASVWVSAGCGACHGFARAGSTARPGSTAPDLDRWLATDAARVGLPVDTFAYRRIYYGGRGMVAYGPSLDAQALDDLVSFVAGHSFTAPPGTVAPVPALPEPPPPVTVPARTVSKWKKTARLPRKAAPGAALFAKVGCLSCHRYLGAGKRRRSAPDLSSIGRTGKTAAWFRRYLARPYAFGNVTMPAYADLGAKRLGSLAAFLAASRGRR